MHPDLPTLLEIQDLRAKVREFEAGTELEELEQEHFHIQPEEAVAQLRERIRGLEDELSPRVRKRYDRVERSLNRVVVPVINGVCYGCLVSIATAVAGDREVHQQLQTCENCGRFLYVLE
jgi:predicted  nucleic acid-binding Zn-ribbon protein